MFRSFLIAAVVTVLFVSHHAYAAATLMECKGPAHIQNIVEPWEEATKTYAKGKIRIIWLDTGGEPACCSSHLAIIAPDPKNEQGYPQCKILNDGQEFMGFQSINLKGVQSSYDPSKGLLLSVPVERYIDGIKSKKATIGVRINQATGDIVIE